MSRRKARSALAPMFALLVLLVPQPCPAQDHPPATSRTPPGCRTPEKSTQAVADLLATLDSHPTADGYNALGTLYGRAGEFACAVAAFEAAIAFDPNSSQTHYNLALALMENHNATRAVDELRVVLKQSPESFRAHNALGVALQDLGRMDAAQNEFEAALKLNPRFALGCFDLARLLSSEKRTTGAIYYFKQGLAASPPGELAAQMKLGLAVAYAQREDYARAIPLLRELIAREPAAAELHFDLGTAYAHREEYSQAVQEYKKALELDRDHEPARLSLAKALMNMSEVPESVPYAEDYTRRKPQDPAGWEVLGEALKAAGRPQDAESALRRSTQLDPSSYKAHYNLGAVLARLGRNDEAIAELETAKKLNADGTEALYQLGLLLGKKGSQTGAKEDLEAFQQLKLEAARKTRARALMNRGTEQFVHGHAREAAEAFREASRLTPNDAKGRFYLALALGWLGDHAGERRELEKAVQLDPKFAQAHNQLGQFEMAEGKTGEAERHFKAAMESDPAYAEAENNLGVLYGKEGRNAEAEGMFHRAATDDPQYAQAFLNWGLVLANQGRFANAVEQFEQAIRLRPGFVDAQTALGMAQAKMGRGKEAVATFRRVVALEPNSSPAHLNLGIALADQFDKESALAEFTEAIRLAPASPVAHFNRGRLLYDLGRRQAARPEFDTACRFSPDYPDALYFLALLERQGDNFSRSAQLLEHLVKIQPQNSDAQYLLGQDLFHLGETDEAIAHWKAAVQANPENASALYNLTRTLQKAGRPEAEVYLGRLEAFEKKRQLTDRVERLGNFALEAANAGNWPLAIEQSREALQLCGACPQSPQLHRNLGLIYCRKGDLKEARHELETALEIKPGDAGARKALEILSSLPRRIP